MAEVNDVNVYALIWTALRYIIAGLLSILGIFSLWILGRYRVQHETMYNHYIDNTGDNYRRLKEMKQTEWEKFLLTLKDIQHDVNAVRQQQNNFQILFDAKMEELSKKG